MQGCTVIGIMTAGLSPLPERSDLNPQEHPFRVLVDPHECQRLTANLIRTAIRFSMRSCTSRSTSNPLDSTILRNPTITRQSYKSLYTPCLATRALSSGRSWTNRVKSGPRNQIPYETSDRRLRLNLLNPFSHLPHVRVYRYALMLVQRE